MRIEELRYQRVALLGLGNDVRSALRFVAEVEPQELLLVESSPEIAAAADDGSIVVDGVRLELVSLEAASARAEVFVRSPGFPRYLQPLVEAREAGALMTTPLDLFMGAIEPGQKVVAITGTKGKSTTTELIHEFALAAGMRVGVAGNLGVPVFDPGWDSTAPLIVLEVSSYQASDLHHVPDIAVLTSLAEDHLDWHGGVDTYVKDKLRVLSNGGRSARLVIVPATDANAVAAAQPFEHVVVESPETADGLPVQRIQNAALAAEVIAQLEMPRPTVPEVLAAAGHSMPGRLDLCPSAPGSGFERVRFVDDTLASNPAAAAAGLAWARTRQTPTVLLLGGSDRGVSIDVLRAEVARWQPELLKVVALPDNGERVAGDCGLSIYARAETVAESVSLASDALEGEGIVLFSPAAPTPGRFGNWETRSNEFRRAIEGLVAS